MKNTAVLLLHGYSGSPFEMEFLAHGLSEQGLTVSVPALPGHATDFADFQTTRFADWQQKAEESFLELQTNFHQVVVVGYSMGGTLALSLGAKFSPAGIVCISCPICLTPWAFWKIPDWRLPFLFLLRWIKPVLNSHQGRPASRRIAPWQGYEGHIALHPFYSMLRGLSQTRKKLGEVQAPLLVLHGKRDRHVPPENAWWILREAGSRRKQLELVHLEETVTSGHLLTTHQECKQLLLERCLFFIEGLPDSSPGI